MAVWAMELLRSNQELWEHFTRREEYGTNHLDEHGRFPSTATVHGPLLEPRVSRYLVDKGLKVDYPDGKRFAVCLTHDVDLLKPSSLRNIRLPGQVKSALRLVSRKFRAAWSFDEIMDLEQSFGAKSTFFFMALHQGERDFNYDALHLQKEMKNILQRGWGIGLHGGHEASVDLELLKAEKARLERSLGRSVLSYRNHYMKLKVPATWRNLSAAGFKTDSTLGYAGSIGFRNGMCHPFKPYDLDSESTIDLIELPLAVMDTTLYSYVGLDSSKAWEATKPLIDRVMQLNGVFTLLWHNTYMLGDKLELYRKILEYCHGKGAWMTDADEIAKWWRDHGCFGTG